MISLPCHSCHQVFQVEKPGDYHCPHCKTINHYTDRILSAWETKFRTDFFPVLIQTIKEVLTAPVIFFQNLKISEAFWPVVLFGVLCQTIGHIANFLYQAGFSFFFPLFLGGVSSFSAENLMGSLVTPFFLGGLLLVTPLITLLGIVIAAAVYHFFLCILGGARNGFQATLHAIGYSSAANILMIIPLLGGFIAGIFQIILIIIGLKELHEISYGKSALAVLIPVFLVCGLILAAMGILAAILIPMILNAMHSG